MASSVVAAGVPIGSDAFTLGTMQAKLASHERAHQQLRRLGDDFCQIAYLLLRFCLNARRLLDANGAAARAPAHGGADRERAAAV